MAQKTIRAYTVFYEDAAAEGVEHLAYVLSSGESDSLFYNARISGKVEFEDRAGRNFTLIGKPDGKFIVKKRNGWF